ncbi:MAG: hypothetical protein IKT60_04810 [Clostridia bacterium]|nr:hypothetical protein [Clostridia bacterium]
MAIYYFTTNGKYLYVAQYVSCDPATLARDVALLKQRGYGLKNAQAADLFPRCAHVEAVCLLSRKDK